jgi:hypothetical protein
MIGLAAIGVAAVVAVVMTIGIFLPAIGAMTSRAIRPVEAASLPAQISVCDRDYGRSSGAPKSVADVRAADGTDPVVVGASGGCPAGVCGATGTCLDVVYLQTTDDRYAAYELLDQSS